MISTGSLLISGGTFTQTIEAGSREFDSLAQRVATRAHHDSGELSDPAKCHPETRVAILTHLKEWAEGSTYNSPIKWITGSAGVGKTAIMHTIAEILERKQLLLADFFFWRTGEHCNTADFFIATLAYQIAISMPSTRPHIENIVKRDPHIFTRTLEVQSQALIIDPIISVYQENNCGVNYPRIIIVDGLDECLGEKQSQDIEKQTEVLQVLHWTLSQLPIPFALLIASRPECHIQRRFDTILKDTSSSIMLNDSYNADADIRTFYLAKFNGIREHHLLRSYLPAGQWPPTHIVDELVHRASGQFIYVSTVTRFVTANKKNPSDQLQVILDANIRGNTKPFQSLDLLYFIIFTAIEEEDLAVTLWVLGILLLGRSRTTRAYRTFSPDSLPPSFWDKFLGLQRGEMQRLMLGLESILSMRGPSGKYFRFYHASLQDFLFDSSRSGLFFINAEVVYEDLAIQSIRHLYTFNDDIETYIFFGMPFWFKYARPSSDLHASVRQFKLPIHPRHLKLRVPIFLGVVKQSVKIVL
ncbi:hypothetical protein CPB84DRAFT_1748618 [Gymnopilus junonius]|uniref:Nephrocystin 3-like N-terminal domain-containing protein n=1 Tax=Gymnopilus junonius TaxID=109634 RepID=A0A9P5NJJ7_GYMJU|nr:hypothetical protein CPB84DRAFT_1748618 [Gymnopilus junonius]